MLNSTWFAWAVSGTPREIETESHKGKFSSREKRAKKCTCMADTSNDLNLSTEYYSLLIVNAQNKRCGNRTATKGEGVAGRQKEALTTDATWEIYV